VSAVRELVDSGDYGDGVPPAAIKDAVDSSPAAVEHGLEKANQDGSVWEPTEGRYKPT
jgi:hypothetical protein